MYQLIQKTRKTNFDKYDYVFEDFNSFYQTVSVLTVPLVGKYTIGIKTDVVQEIYDFVSVEMEYMDMVIDIYVPESTINYISMYRSDIKITGRISPFSVFKELIQQKSVLFANMKLVGIVYASIDHDVTVMSIFLDSLVSEFGANTLITEKMLESKLILNKVVYPRQVLISFLKMEKYRKSKLYKCLETMGNDIVLGAMVKGIKAILEAKQVYFKTGKVDNTIKYLDTQNVMQMYRVLVTERMGLNDVVLLLDLYERGLSTYALIQKG